jgi:hypothetical protein
MKIQFALALAFLIVAPATALAQTQEEQDACTGDAMGICGEFIPDRGQVAACLARNINRISPACRTVMHRYQPPAPSAAVAKPVTAPTTTKSGVAAAAAKKPHGTTAPRNAKGPLNIKPTLDGAPDRHTASRS